MDIRAVVQREVGRRKWTTYRLWKAVEGRVSKPTVYGFLSGTASINVEGLGHVLDALDLTITSKAKGR